jgi:hypothetical protein
VSVNELRLNGQCPAPAVQADKVAGEHRERMQKEDLESKFKSPDDPLRLVFGHFWLIRLAIPRVQLQGGNLC